MSRVNEIIGYSRFVSKKGVDTLIVDVVMEATEFNRRYGRVGNVVEQVFIPESLFDKFDDSVVGKLIDVKYDGRGRYANIIDVSFSD